MDFCLLKVQASLTCMPNITVLKAWNGLFLTLLFCKNLRPNAQLNSRHFMPGCANGICTKAWCFYGETYPNRYRYSLFRWEDHCRSTVRLQARIEYNPKTS